MCRAVEKPTYEELEAECIHYRSNGTGMTALELESLSLDCADIIQYLGRVANILRHQRVTLSQH